MTPLRTRALPLAPLLAAAIFLAILAAIASAAPARAEDERLYPLEWHETGGHGLVTATGEWAIPPLYDHVVAFHEGLAAVTRDGRAGYIDPTGAWALEPVHDAAARFSEGLAAVKTGRHWGYIRRDGSRLAEPVFDYAGPFEGGLAVVKLDRKWGVIDTNPVWVVMPEYRRVRIVDGLVVVTERRKVDGRNTTLHGLFDPAKGWLLKTDYKQVFPIGEGLFRVTEGRLDGLYSPAAGWLREPGFAKIGLFVPLDALWGAALAAAKEGERAGFLATDGSWAIAPEFEDVKSFSEGLAAARSGGLWGFVDHRGEWAIPPRFEDVDEPFVDGQAIVRVPLGVGPSAAALIDRSGAFVYPPTRSALPTGQFSDGLAPAWDMTSRGSTHGYVNRRGEWVVPPTLKTAGRFRDGYAIVSTGEAKGILAPDGSWILEPEFYEIYPDGDLFLTLSQDRSRRQAYYRRDGTKLEIQPPPAE